MRKMLKLLVIFMMFAAVPSIVNACDIVVTVGGIQKEKYKAGDIVVLKITVVLKHRNCDVSLVR
jgi:hypothetical protein